MIDTLNTSTSNVPTVPSDPRVARYRELSLSKKRIEEEMEGIKAELLEELAEGEVLFTPEGVGYRKAVKRSAVYGLEALEIIRKYGVSAHFMKVSDAGLLRLKKQGLLRDAQIQRIQSLAEVKESEYLQEVIPQESKVF